MTPLRRLGRLAAILAAAAASSIALPAAQAASPSPTPVPTSGGKTITVPADQVTFAVGTANPLGADGRPSFTFTGRPGDVITDNVIVYNLGKIKATLAVYPIDAVQESTGAFALALLNDKQTGIGSWATVGKKKDKVVPVTLAGGTSTVVPFTIRIPKDAVPGDNVGGIVVSSIPNAAGGGNQEQALATATRLGVRTVVRVAGDLTAAVQVENLTTSFEPSLTAPGFGRLTVSWTVRNTGNVRVAVDRSLTVSALLGGTLIDQGEPKLDQMLPGDSVNESATFDGVFAGIRLSTTVTATPTVLDGDVPNAGPASATSTIWAISWILLLIILLILGLGFWLWRRMRRRALVAAAATSTSGPGGRHAAAAAAPASESSTPRDEVSA